MIKDFAVNLAYKVQCEGSKYIMIIRQVDKSQLLSRPSLQKLMLLEANHPPLKLRLEKHFSQRKSDNVEKLL